MDVASEGYLSNLPRYLCPDNTNQYTYNIIDDYLTGTPLNDSQVSFRFKGGLNVKSDPATPICWDKVNNHEKDSKVHGNILYVGDVIKNELNVLDIKDLKGSEWLEFNNKYHEKDLHKPASTEP